jgi:hypothetical protein
MQGNPVLQETDTHLGSGQYQLGPASTLL